MGWEGLDNLFRESVSRHLKDVTIDALGLLILVPLVAQLLQFTTRSWIQSTTPGGII